MDEESGADRPRAITDNITTDFYVRLVNAVRLKEFAVEFGYELPAETIDTINALAWRAGIIEFRGSRVLADKYIDINEEDVSALDGALLTINSISQTRANVMSGATAPMLYAFMSRPRRFDISLEEHVEEVKQANQNSQLFWLLAFFLLLDVLVLPTMTSTTAPILIGVIEVFMIVWLRYARIPQWLKRFPRPNG